MVNFYVMFLKVLPECMYVCHKCEVPGKARRGRQIMGCAQSRVCEQLFEPEALEEKCSILQRAWLVQGATLLGLQALV